MKYINNNIYDIYTLNLGGKKCMTFPSQCYYTSYIYTSKELMENDIISMTKKNFVNR